MTRGPKKRRKKQAWRYMTRINLTVTNRNRYQNAVLSAVESVIKCFCDLIQRYLAGPRSFRPIASTQHAPCMTKQTFVYQLCIRFLGRWIFSNFSVQALVLSTAGCYGVSRFFFLIIFLAGGWGVGEAGGGGDLASGCVRDRSWLIKGRRRSKRTVSHPPN